jgi:hypothetical protein
MLQTKEINRRAVQNELKKHVELIPDKALQKQMKKQIKEENEQRMEQI